jgi:tripartite-type tricarboxylate transporter receptor subunit TctC
MRWTACGALVAILANQTAASADPVADFYKGKDIAFIVGFDGGGGYDNYARIIARHMGRQIPGAPTVVIQNMPGAGGIRAANQLYNVSARDGTVLGMIDQSLPTQQLIAPEGMKTDVGKFNWIGRIASNAAVFYGWRTAPVQKIGDAFSNELIVSSSGQSSRMLSALMKNQLGLNLKVLTGYKGTSEARIAMQRGEIHALTQPWSALRAESATLLSEGKLNLLLQMGAESHPDLPNVPTLVDLARSDDERRLLAMMVSGARIGRSILSPPGQPPARVALLRAAFMKTVGNEFFISEMNKVGLDLDPMSGEELQAMLVEIGNISPALLAQARKAAEVVRAQ